MAAYVIAKKDKEILETTIFASEGGDAVAVFTDSNNASRYIDEAGWKDEMTVAELGAIDFMEWLIACYRNGVKLMATDPKRSEQEMGLKLNTLEIEAQLDHAGKHITQVANRDF